LRDVPVAPVLGTLFGQWGGCFRTLFSRRLWVFWEVSRLVLRLGEKFSATCFDVKLHCWLELVSGGGAVSFGNFCVSIDIAKYVSYK